MTNKALDRLARSMIASIVFNAENITEEDRAEVVRMLREIQVHTALTALMRKEEAI